MSKKYSLTFLLLAFVWVMAGLVAWETIRWVAAVFYYAALSFALVALAYAGAGPTLLLKRPTGRRSLLGYLLLAPYFLLSDLSFQIYKLLSNEPAFVEVAPNLFFGRRLSAAEAKVNKWLSVLDLAVEFSEVRALRSLSGYHSLPVLDATAPSEEQLRAAVLWLTKQVQSGPVYTHCALGHGRSVCVVIAYLLSSGQVRTISEGEKQVRSLRPGARLHQIQRRRLAVFEHQVFGPPNR
jgi:protein-tyrosine phosphatase